jgi:HSP20 family protein
MWNLVPWKRDTATPAWPVEREFSRLRSDFDSLLDRMWGPWPALTDQWFDARLSSGLDIEETDSHYVVHVTAPGFDPADFDVSVSGGQLLVKAEKKESRNGSNGSSVRQTRVQRIVPLPEGAQSDLIEAEYKAGILVVKLPKGQQAEPKRIPVKSA